MKIEINLNIKIELLIYTLIFASSIFMPFLTIYELETENVLEVIVGYQSEISIYLFFFFLTGILSTLSKIKLLVHIINPILLLGSILLFLLSSFSMGLAGVQGAYNIGFFVELFVLWTLVIRSYIWFG
jgi:hypothetical protein